jgi:lipopolysaccharide/colanic/teichoic acid biosynthesis glycosyltransferase
MQHMLREATNHGARDGRTTRRPGIAPGLVRRTLDVMVSAAALVLLAPVLLLLAVAVLLESPGGALFRQVRVGQGGRPFTIYKFRTMRSASNGPEFTPRNDPRITRVGRLLRHSGLDELPQLVNVLRGDMTLVGPRPETPSLASRYTASCGRVFAYRPGLTGPAQVRLRDEDALPTDGVELERHYLEEVVPRRAALDLEYLADPSLRRTLGHLVETALYVVRV